ncbi:hypothetical protein KKG29_04635 [Patescibacteria group bacterium]|nr:hypothetical protein [Patescibacteria group bacterium]MBU4000424.1 hypothetical protein [Patescibacteria group bacterium]MBU4056637.1 hypothetical protein [Patescibacteria group bacterium]MBU4368441.1 hypothetical protein [Patescibacteria group bacterium]
MNHKMIETTNKKIVEIARRFNKEGVLWHNHFLAVKCIYNTSEKFQVILENEQSGEVYFSNFDKQPTDTLKLLEDLFFEQEKEN